jgi:hypothetical protein
MSNDVHAMRAATKFRFADDGDRDAVAPTWFRLTVEPRVCSEKGCDSPAAVTSPALLCAKHALVLIEEDRKRRRTNGKATEWPAGEGKR